MTPASRHATACTGMASTTSFATMAPLKRSRQRVEEAHAVAEPRCAGGRAARRWFPGSVFAVQLLEQHLGQRAAAGADFQDRAETRRSCRASVRPNRLPSSGAVTKSPCGAELARAAGVVAQARLVQRELHVAREGDPAAVGGDLGS